MIFSNFSQDRMFWDDDCSKLVPDSMCVNNIGVTDDIIESDKTEYSSHALA